MADGVFTLSDLEIDPSLLMAIMQTGVNYRDWFLATFPNGAASKESVLAALQNASNTSMSVSDLPDEAVMAFINHGFVNETDIFEELKKMKPSKSNKEHIVPLILEYLKAKSSSKSTDGLIHRMYDDVDKSLALDFKQSYPDVKEEVIPDMIEFVRDNAIETDKHNLVLRQGDLDAIYQLFTEQCYNLSSVSPMDFYHRDINDDDEKIKFLRLAVNSMDKGMSILERLKSPKLIEYVDAIIKNPGILDT